MFVLIELYKKFVRKWSHIRLQPICVFCFHNVCVEFDRNAMDRCDWISIDNFKNRLYRLCSDGYEFISLSDAYKHICKDWFRRKRYAVITFDDGYASLKEILPWLQEKMIPVTLFVNGKYLDGISYRNNPDEKYFTKDELSCLESPLVEIGNHGWEHTDSCKMSSDEFKCSVLKNIEVLSCHPRYIPFWAYTWGQHNEKTDSILIKQSLVPVLMDGTKNFNDKSFIHRMLLK